jgi:hypothetical protein
MAANLQPISSDGGFTSGGNINLDGNLNFNGGNIVQSNNDDLLLTAVDNDGIVSSSVELSPNSTLTRIEQWSGQDSLSFTTSDWATGTYTIQAGLGAVVFTGATNIINALNALVETGHIFFSVNGGPQLVWDGTSAGGGTITFYTPTVPATDPTTVTSFDYYYSYKSGFEIDYDSNEVNIYANEADLKLETTGQRDIGLNSSGSVTLTANSALNWTFDTVGNLTLPGNTFAVNYANGTQVSIGGGSGNTGNVTFDDVTVQGDNSVLNLSAGPDFTANLAYLQLRAGDVASHIHLETGNATAYDLIVGDDQKFVQVSSTGNIVMSSYDGNTSYTWTLDTTGNLILAGGESVIQSVANSSLDPLNPNVSTMVLTPDPGYSSQSLVLDPTLPGHIHLRAPGSNIDEPTANLFLGGEASSFEVGYSANSSAPNVYIHSGGNTWTFDTTGILVFPRDTSNISTDPILNIIGGANPTITSTDASLAGPANLGISALTTTFTGFTGDAIKIYPDDGEISSTANLQIWANSGGNTEYSWTFDTTGNLTLPGNAFAINYANGTQVPVGVTQDITSNGAMSIMLYDGNIKYNNYATVEPSTGNITGGNLITTGSVTAANITLPNSSILTFGDTPVTNRYYVDATRTDTYTQNGSQARPFKTISGAQAAIATAIIGGLNPEVEPIYIILLSNITENVTLATNHVYLVGQSGQIHQPIILSGNVTVNPTSGTLGSNHFSITGIEVVGGTNGKAIYVTGTSPLRLSLQDVWITANGTGAGLYQDNSGSGTYTHGGPLKVSHNGSGDVYCFDIRSGTASFDTVETSGATQVGAAGPGATLTFNNSQLDANGDVVVETYGSGVLVVTNSAIKNSQANGFGIKLNAVANVAGTVSVGQSAFNVPTGTGQAVWLDPNTTVGLSGVFAWAGVSFYPGTNTTINPSIIPAPLTTLVGTIAAPIIVGDITATGTAQDWDLIDNNASALSFDTTGKTGIINLVTTNGSEGVTMSGYANVTGNVIAGNLMGPLANGNSSVTIATAAGNVVANVNGATVFTAYSGGIKVGGSGILQSPGGAGSITLNNNGANIPTANITNTLNVTGASGANITANLTAGNISTGGTLTSTGKFGYASGSTVTQTSNRGNGVNINALAGTIVTVSASMTAGEIGAFSVTNNQVDTNNDIVLVQVVSPNLGNYNVIANPNSGIGGFYLTLQNISGFPISPEAVTIRFMVIKAPNA